MLAAAWSRRVGASGVLVGVSIMRRYGLPPSATGTVFPSGVTATSQGRPPTAMLAVTALVAVSSTTTVLSTEQARYTCRPSGATARPAGFRPTGTVAVTELAVVSMIESVLSRRLLT